ncbi:hypothetical protein VTJ04DRAFT_10700 [Mycothermus thermophilus]|uniref:uncharacterized protein n=1 Tax=Humicola insolens TaxID=85995 RepID=UPI003743D5D7
MFGNISLLAPVGIIPRIPRKDVPPPTPINLPRCAPRLSDKPDQDSPAKSAKPLPAVLQTIIRPNDVSLSHLEALGVHVVPDADLADLIPDPAYIPDFEAWLALSPDEAHAQDFSTRKPLNATKPSPGCEAYRERRKELEIPNDTAFRAIRRLPPLKGQPPIRLGNAYEFFRNLELYSAYWEDTSKPPPSESKPDQEDGAATADQSSDDKKPENDPNEPEYYRTSAGHDMPADYRNNMINAFLKLVAFDFACSVQPARVEPRLFITSRTPSGAERNSYFSSGCTFIYRAPATRETARAGIVDGPVAAVSARHVTSFPPPPAEGQGPDKESTLDLAREIVAALITAQLRAREGKEEKKIGEGAWWCTKPRWGGGPGGPIGREVDMLSGEDQTVGDKDAPVTSEVAVSGGAGSASPARGGVALPQRSRPPFAGIPGQPSSGFASIAESLASDSSADSKSAKRLKKSGNLPMYDNYRALRPPSSTWDKKTRYEAIGRVRGADYDDIFVVSSLFHHVSVVRVRVPDRLLKVLAGETEDGVDGTDPKHWGGLKVWRSRWFDFFKAEERVKAFETVWCMMNWMMRKMEEEEKGDGDVKMTGA